MSSGEERDRRVLALFEQALALPEAEREAFLAGLSEGDRPLRAEVAELLELEVHTDGFLEPGPLAETSLAATTGAPEPEAGQRIGPYRLLRCLGRGGMGAVYEAEQDEPRRLVAVKLMRPEVLGAASRERFRREAAILARLNHPGIARVYEVGVARLGEGSAARDVPFYAMEYVEGARSLLEYAGAAQLGLPERVELMADVCDAVQHGHGRGVLHRDLKPANLLVDSEGRPRVIDFGIARIVDVQGGDTQTTGLTLPGQIVGTLGSLPPESFDPATAEPDVRGDVYALGVVLYELLSGRQPHDLEGVPLHEVARRVCEQPPRPLPPEVPRDLAAVVGKALETDPSRRYGSVLALADDLRRWLRHETVVARPPSLAWQARLFARRHRGMVVSVLVALVGLVAALGVSLHERGLALEAAESEAEARRLAEGAAAAEAAARELAQQAALAEGVARRRADELFQELLESHLVQVEQDAARIFRLPGAVDVARDMLQRSVEGLSRLAAQGDVDAPSRRAIAFAMLRLGDLLRDKAGDVEGAGEALMQAAEMTDALMREDPGNPEVRGLQADVLRRKGSQARWEDRPQDAQRHAEDALAVLQVLVTEQPQSSAWRRRLAKVHGDLAMLAGSMGDMTACVHHIEAERDLIDQLLQAQPDDEGLLESGAYNAERHAGALYKLGRYPEALAAYAELEQRFASLAARDSTDADHARNAAEARMWAGSMELLLERLEDAEVSFRAARAQLERLAAADPHNAQYAPSLANLAWSLGGVCAGRAEAAGGQEALELWEQARSYYEQARDEFGGLADKGFSAGWIAAQHARIDAELGRCDEALRRAQGGS